MQGNKTMRQYKEEKQKKVTKTNKSKNHRETHDKEKRTQHKQREEKPAPRQYTRRETLKGCAVRIDNKRTKQGHTQWSASSKQQAPHETNSSAAHTT